MTYLDVDANRRGLETLRASYVRAAVLDLKHFVSCFRDNRSQGLDYEDGDETLFSSNETAAQAAGMYLKSRLVRHTEKDLSLEKVYMGDYVTLRRRLMRDCTELKLMHAKTDSSGEAQVDDQGQIEIDDKG